jgi:uncharacterized protein
VALPLDQPISKAEDRGRDAKAKRIGRPEVDCYRSCSSQARTFSMLFGYPHSFRSYGDRIMSTSRRGFASMNPERQREIASKGGKSVPAEKRSFSQNRDLAAEAGRKGGLVSQNGQNANAH